MSESVLAALTARGDHIVNHFTGADPWSEDFLRAGPSPIVLPLQWFNDLRIIAEEIRIVLRRSGREAEIREGRLVWYGRQVVST